MASRLVYNVVYKRVSGQEPNQKVFWETCGAIFESEYEGKRRMSMRLNSIPVGFTGSFYLFPPKPRGEGGGEYDQRPASERQQQGGAADILGGEQLDGLNPDDPINLDDIPF